MSIFTNGLSIVGGGIRQVSLFPFFESSFFFFLLRNNICSLYSMLGSDNFLQIGLELEMVGSIFDCACRYISLEVFL